MRVRADEVARVRTPQKRRVERLQIAQELGYATREMEREVDGRSLYRHPVDVDVVFVVIAESSVQRDRIGHLYRCDHVGRHACSDQRTIH